MPDISEVKAYLSRFGLQVVEYEQPTPTAETAARVVGCSVGEIAKTILLTVGRRTVAVLAAGDTRVNSACIKKASGFSGKVRLLPPEKVVETVGYPPGGVCPFLLPPEIPLYLDLSLQRFVTVYPAAGTTRSAVAVAVEKLPEITGGTWAEVTRQEEGQ
ncbi:prolyl-tRNA editing enzyme YbaK/EbsC (Cys-tRNA(Pro) deacylase) [Geothermobacter ehrlichii]|uniref:Prolyl-tRNA editing enzyme YbaK/EbsC (Cys-tRNA(Pro) deacylase) n=1 Tax=Geothermobacter ehrlichii TaxID=213224 RepID=A0A5D3WP82_9BACT|nr:YbaK/EbsC family protein [Geothermobacter ehrlichii]TYP00345.1 prolyl-tRNA editing enzyme YbaK/EbsC (Cys-tRNA(Pro) deacylase) [Geothermobacter ehrlichii]